MASPHESAKNYNHELIQCIDDLRSQRTKVVQQIQVEEREKEKIEKQMNLLSNRLSNINQSLEQNREVLDDYDKTIKETEDAYEKILESSQTLLRVLRRETVALGQKEFSGKRENNNTTSSDELSIISM